MLFSINRVLLYQKFSILPNSLGCCFLEISIYNIRYCLNTMASERVNLSHPEIAHISFYSREEMERIGALHALRRFSSIEKMTHRTSVAEHTLRVMTHSFFFTKMLLCQGVLVDLKKVNFFADHHDDPEIVTGDISTLKKRDASEEEKAKMEQDEKSAVSKVDRLIQKPLGFRDFPQEYEEYKSQKSLEAQIVNYLDKWDALHEAIHEVVCGENKEGFEQVIRDYRHLFEELNDKNRGWQDKLKTILGNDFFTVPDPDKLAPKFSEKLNYKTAGDFMRSLYDGNPRSYFFWLRFNKSLFKLDFLLRTFPGWMDKFPREILEDIERVRTKAPFKKMPSGLLIPSIEIDLSNLTFGESLGQDTLEVQLVMASQISNHLLS